MDVREPFTQKLRSSIHAGVRGDELGLRIAPVRHRMPK